MAQTGSLAYGNGYDTLAVKKGKVKLPDALLEVIRIKNHGLPGTNQDILHVFGSKETIDSEITGYEYRTARDYLKQFFNADGNAVSPTIETILSAKTTKTPISKNSTISLPKPYMPLEEVLIIYYENHFVITQPENIARFI